MSQELIVFVTTPNHEEALRLAENLVSERLCACVNVLPAIESVYRWEGKITKDQELLLIIKTSDERYQELEKRILELHSYTTPEVIAVKIERGSNAYLEWLRQSVSLDSD
jgi:periplasmic divalent cation tolerance protein